MPRDLDRYRGRLAHRAAWLSVGMHPRDLASDRFTTVFPGYLTPTLHPATLNAMAWVLQNKVLPGSLPSHSLAALLWDLPLPARFENGIGILAAHSGEHQGVPLIPPVPEGRTLGVDAELPLLHCLVENGGRSRIGRGVVVHRGGPVGTVRVGRLELPVRGEVLRQLGTLLPLWDLVAVVDAILCPGARFPAGSALQLGDVLESGARRAGTALARKALALARPDVRSPGETVMRLLMASAGLPPPVPNLPVHDPRTGRTRYIDLAWENAGLGLEYDGDGHRRTKEQWREDEVRRDELARQGWTLIRANGSDLWRPRRVLLRVRDALAERKVLVPDDRRLDRALQEIAEKRPSLRISPGRL